eukprot:763409-Hanusia_phi.AAC.3
MLAQEICILSDCVINVADVLSFMLTIIINVVGSKLDRNVLDVEAGADAVQAHHDPKGQEQARALHHEAHQDRHRRHVPPAEAQEGVVHVLEDLALAHPRGPSDRDAREEDLPSLYRPA